MEFKLFVTGIAVLAVFSLILVSGCVFGFDQKYGELKEVMDQHGLSQGELVPATNPEIESFKISLNNLKEEIQGEDSSRENSALLLLIEVRQDLADMGIEFNSFMDNYELANNQCNTLFFEALNDLQAASQEANDAKTKYALFESTYPEFVEAVDNQAGFDFSEYLNSTSETMQAYYNTLNTACSAQ